MLVLYPTPLSMNKFPGIWPSHMMENSDSQKAFLVLFLKHRNLPRSKEKVLTVHNRSTAS